MLIGQAILEGETLESLLVELNRRGTVSDHLDRESMNAAEEKISTHGQTNAL